MTRLGGALEPRVWSRAVVAAVALSALGCGNVQRDAEPGKGGAPPAVFGEFHLLDPLPEHSAAARENQGAVLETWVIAATPRATSILGISRWYGATAADQFGASEIVRWTPSTGLLGLGQLADVDPSGAYYVGAYSADHATVLAFWRSQRKSRLFRWTERDGMSELFAPGATPVLEYRTAFLSADGTRGAVEAFDLQGSHTLVIQNDGSLFDIGSIPNQSIAEPVYMSSDGRTIYGIAGNCGEDCEVFRWTEEHGVETVPAPQGMSCLTEQIHPGADGVIITATCAEPDPSLSVNQWSYDAFVYREATGWLRIGGLPGCLSSQVQLVDPAGTHAFGTVICGDGAQVSLRAWRWTVESGIAPFDPPSGYETVLFSSLSEDGSTLVGNLQGGSGSVGYRWTAEAGFEPLPLPNGDRVSSADGASLDALRIDGQSAVNSESSYLPLVWLDRTPVRVRDLFASDLAKRPNVELDEVHVSADGQLLTGHALQHGQGRGWFAPLSSPN